MKFEIRIRASSILLAVAGFAVGLALQHAYGQVVEDSIRFGDHQETYERVSPYERADEVWLEKDCNAFDRLRADRVRPAGRHETPDSKVRTTTNPYGGYDRVKCR
ncbi:MAG: hypothetical protein LPL29_07645 [Alphaproteobacteria bacterium]|nr:hypothetical protein [Alphaproteobacteria bacterium]